MIKILKLPVMLVAMFAFFMFIFGSADIGYEIRIPGHIIYSLATFILGTLVIATGGYSFRKEKTTLNPMTPEQTTKLVTTGIYSYSRNPMYVGFLAWLLASAIYIGNVVNLLLLPLFILLVNRLYILPEEEILEKLFENDFRKYKKSVRRWI